jgi:hypothetical protein
VKLDPATWGAAYSVAYLVAIAVAALGFLTLALGDRRRRRR